jgi:alkylation response protein AidB-like acyl-CoA dehydrogenase
MDLALSENQRSVEELFGSFFENECPAECVRRAEPLGFDASLWQRFAETGATGMGLPESLGGSDGSHLDAAVVSEVLGRSLAPLPFIEHFVASRLLARCLKDDPELAVLAGSDAIATLALHPAEGARAPLVPAGAVATHVLALVDADLVLHEGAPPHQAAANFAASPLADRDVGDGTRRVLLSGDEGRSSHAEALDEWRALTANALVGVAQGAFDLGLAYARERTQFGVSIGSFQALQHRFADLAVALDGARLLARKAAWAFDEDPSDFRRLAGMALLYCGDVANATAAFALHVHGGYGVSREYDIQLYFRRAKGWRLVLDDPAVEIAKLGDELLGPRQGMN